MHRRLNGRPALQAIAAAIVACALTAPMGAGPADDRDVGCVVRARGDSPETTVAVKRTAPARDLPTHDGAGALQG